MSTPTNSSSVTLPAAAHLASDVRIDIPKDYTPKDADQAVIPKVEKKIPWWKPTWDKLIFLACGVFMGVIFVGLVRGLYKLSEDVREHRNILN